MAIVQPLLRQAMKVLDALMGGAGPEVVYVAPPLVGEELERLWSEKDESATFMRVLLNCPHLWSH